MASPSCTRHPVLGAASVLMAMAAGCTDSGLEPARRDQGQVFDDEIHLSGEVCLTPPADASFPVKILFVVDTSDSMSVTDRDATRAAAIAKVMDRYAAQPGVQFAVLAFDSRIDRVTDGFTSNPDRAAIANRLSMADRLTDYQGALGTAYQMISEDIVAASAAERARSKYVVVFFSDGTPDPQCSSRETACGAGTCPAHQHCRAGVCKDDYLICSVPRQDWQDAFDPPIPEEMYPELDRGADYNQPSQIYRAVDDIIGLQEFYRAGEIRLHTAFLYDPEAASDPLAVPFGLDREGGVALMTAMAEHGFGTFTEFTDASKIDFLSINYTSFKQENGLAMVMATNVNAVDTGAGLKCDTDADGLLDEVEAGATCVGSKANCSDPADSDGDGYSDLFEQRNLVSGFDPMDRGKPLTPCSSKGDMDGDLLRDCEEQYLETDPLLPDTDGDRVPDGVELRLGMDPLDREDVYADPDRDGERSLDEVKSHTSPTVAATWAAPVVRYLYDVVPVSKPTGEKCFQLDVRHIKLVTTGKGTESRLGVNRVLLYFDEAPLDRARDPGSFRVACMDVRYVDGALKSPWDGRIPLLTKEECLRGTAPPAPPPTPCTYLVPALSFNQRDNCPDLTAFSPPVPDAGTSVPGSP